MEYLRLQPEFETNEKYLKSLGFTHHEICLQKPNPGPFHTVIKEYYFYTQLKKYKEFVYCFCKDSVPFKKFEKCQKSCNLE